jgi:hypothetical protein
LPSSCRYPAGDPLRAIALASMMAVVSGLLCILAGIARLGFVTELLSKPIRYGYMNGIALTVLISQLPKLFGFSVEADDPLHRIREFVQALLAGKTNATALLVGGGHPGTDHAAQARQAHPGDTDRGDRRHRPRRNARPDTSTACRCSVRCRRACPPSPSRGSRRPTSCLS